MAITRFAGTRPEGGTRRADLVPPSGHQGSEAIRSSSPHHSGRSRAEKGRTTRGEGRYPHSGWTAAGTRIAGGAAVPSLVGRPGGGTFPVVEKPAGRGGTTLSGSAFIRTDRIALAASHRFQVPSFRRRE